MNTSDQKSIFGVLVGLAALFLLWLWASGNAAKIFGAATTTTASTTPGGGAAPNAGSFGTYTGSPATSVASGYGSNIDTTPTTLISAVNIPQYINTTAAIQKPSSQTIGGNTFAGAQSGGVQVTPSVLYNTTSVPANTGISSNGSSGSASSSGSDSGLGGTVQNWLLNVLDPLGIGGGSVSPNASFGTYNDPSVDTTAGTFVDGTDVAAGTYEPD